MLVTVEIRTWKNVALFELKNMLRADYETDPPISTKTTAMPTTPGLKVGDNDVSRPRSPRWSKRNHADTF